MPEYKSKYTGAEIDALLDKVDGRTSTPAPAEDKLITSGGVYTGLAGKTDKVTSPTAGNLPKLKADGSLEDSGKKPSDFVEKEAGKGLSTNDYTNEDKTKLGALPTNAGLQTALGNKEDKSNKVTSLSNPTDTQYPSAKLVSDSLDKVKADVSSLLTRAGIAEGIADTISAGTAQEFLQRQSGGDGVNCIKRIKGKTIAWNQIIKNNNFATTSDWLANRGTLTVSDNVGTYTITTVASEGYGNHLLQEVAIVASHKYFTAVEIKNPNHPVTLAGDIWAATGIDRTIPASSNWTRRVAISSSVRTATVNFYAFIDDASKQVGDSFQMRNPLVIDLTILYGSEISGMTDAQILSKFQSEYPEFYYGYNPGVLKNNDAVAMITNGRNQWDEQWVNGYYSNGLGVIPVVQTGSTYLSSKNVIPVFPNTTYGITKPSGRTIRIIEVDVNGYSIRVSADSPNITSWTTSSECIGLLFSVWNTPTYANDICINLSDPSFNGKYEPYWKREIQFRIKELTGVPVGGTEADRVTMFPNGLGGAGSAFDSIFVENGVTKARGTMVRLTFNNSFTKGSNAEENVYISSNFGAKNLSQNNVITPKVWDYTSSWYTSMPNKTMRIVEGALVVRDDDYATAEAFNAAMNGGGIIAEATTPIVYTDLQYADGTPFTMPATILVDNYGTERIQAPEGATTPSAPFCCDSNYSIGIANLVRKLSE